MRSRPDCCTFRLVNEVLSSLNVPKAIHPDLQTGSFRFVLDAIGGMQTRQAAKASLQLSLSEAAPQAVEGSSVHPEGNTKSEKRFAPIEVPSIIFN